MHDLLSGQAREIVRTVWDGKQPTALAFLYANSARLLGFLAGDNSNEIILGPVLAVGSAVGTVTLLNLSTLQVRPPVPADLVCTWGLRAMSWRSRISHPRRRHRPSARSGSAPT